VKFTAEQLREAAEYAPPSGPVAEGLRAVKTYSNHLVCAPCSGRILARGLGHFVRGEFVWTDDNAGELGSCTVCGKEV
jgi:hypothetical protein